jgi:hypothetical protein
MRDTVRTVEHEMRATIETAEETVDRGFNVVGRFLGGAVKVVEMAYGLLFGWAMAEPRLTPDQAERKERADEERAEARADHAAQQEHRPADCRNAAATAAARRRSAAPPSPRARRRPGRRARTLSTSADRASAEGSKNRTIPGAIKRLFRAVANALTWRDDEAHEPRRRRRSGETEGELRKPLVHPDPADAPAARGRYAALQPAKAEKAAREADPYVGAHAYLSDTLHWLNLWQDTMTDNFMARAPDRELLRQDQAVPCDRQGPSIDWGIMVRAI